MKTRKAWSLACSALVLALCGGGCAASEPRAVLNVASKNLRCPHSELNTELGRQTPQVREYYVACDFMYTRVHCSAARGCYTAPLKPPCVDGTCFEENPLTLQWQLQRPLPLVTNLAQPSAYRTN